MKKPFAGHTLPKRNAMSSKALLSTGLALTLLACSALSTPLLHPFGGAASSPSDTASPHPTRTRRPTRTPTSEPTQTLPALPSATPAFTPTLPFAVLGSTPSSPTPVLASLTPTHTPPPPLELNCKLNWQSPHNGVIFDIGDKFTAGWSLKNTGTATWDANTFAFVHAAGANISPTEIVRLPNSVPPGASIVLSVPIRTPQRVGTYTTHWGLVRGNVNVSFCRVTLTIQAQLP